MVQSALLCAKDVSKNSSERKYGDITCSLSDRPLKNGAKRLGKLMEKLGGEI